MTREKILEILQNVPYPGFKKDVVSMGVVQDVKVQENKATLTLNLGPGHPSIAVPLERAIKEALTAAFPSSQLHFNFAQQNVKSSPGLGMVGGAPQKPSAAASGSADPSLIPGVKHSIAVASGKGGVGKSTLAVNLSASLAKQGLKVGLLDADLYGPSIPTMLGTHERPTLHEDGKRLLPFEKYGIRYMSLGFLVDADTAVIWRGPLVMKALEQLLRDVVWGELDVMVIDLPPGTGDAQLTISQRLQLTGALMVSTPQDVALADALKGLAMFEKVGVPILGWVENMSGFACPHCGESTDVFGADGVEAAARKKDVPFLGKIPLDPSIRSSSDDGEPMVLKHPNSPATEAFSALAASIQRLLAGESPKKSSGMLGWLTGKRS